MYRFFLSLSRLMALIGGAVLLGLILLICLSILGRSLNGLLHADWLVALMPGLSQRLLAWGVGPINGDYEIVEAGIAFAIFAFLPLCQITYGHAAVDVFTNLLPAQFNRWLTWLIDLLFATVICLIALQLYRGTQAKIANGETSLLLQFPLWWAYVLALVGALACALVSLFLAVARTLEMVSGRSILPEPSALGEGAGH